ncbi:hypothetical protein [Bacillus alkalicola]|uniref:Uncharacterized protein n=2 Tax=Bacillaceae TaxID=186817 RepID=A0ABS6JYM9_9BACI|nr:hypothetical protein [Bacillus alkalicola]MBU9723694.1 hypothetical protein [Bacillus alkalicola]
MTIYLVILIIIAIVISFVLFSTYHEEKSETEVLIFSILLVLTGFVFYYINPNGFFGEFVGLGLVLVGLLLGSMRFLYRS